MLQFTRTIDLYDYEGQVLRTEQTCTDRQTYTDNLATVPPSKVDLTMLYVIDL